MTDLSFPPAGPTTVPAIIPSYLYQEYSDDDDLQAFVAAYNELAQKYGVDWLTTANLPIYTGLAGLLLDWIGSNLYGLPRPTLYTPYSIVSGPFNTVPFNTIPFDFSGQYQSGDFEIGVGIGIFAIGISPIAGSFAPAPTPSGYATSDDTYQRILTWHFFKGDGWYFNVRWLKRRVMRFLYGVNGTDPGINQTNQISVTWGLDGQINIRILNGIRTVLGGAIFGEMLFNESAFDSLVTEFTPYPPVPEAPIFALAMQSGALQMPFQFPNVVVSY